MDIVMAGKQPIRSFLTVAVLCLFVDFALAAENLEKDTGSGNVKVGGKTRDHLNLVYSHNKYTGTDFEIREKIVQQTLQQLLETYKTSVKPLEDAYRFLHLNKDALLEAEIAAKPLILFVGPWSTGKTSFINYLLDIEGTEKKLHTGAEPTTSDFVVLQSGSSYRTMTGMQLVSDRNKSFTSLENFGQNFIQRLHGIEIKSPLLELVSLVDTPGIIENKKQQERGYPFSEVIQWFLQRASLIFLMFDISKLEIGSELEIVFNQLKGYESKLKIIFNKADTVSQQELMKVYGALFWNLAPIVHSVEPPRVYVGSFWSKAKTDHPLAKLFLEEEQSLIQDLHHIIENWVEDKIAYVRTHAFQVRLHALTVDSFINAYNKNIGYLSNTDLIWSEIINHPEKFNVFHDLMQQTDISKHDLPDAKTYLEFFYHNQIHFFSPLKYYCHFFGGCDIDKLTDAIRRKLPALLESYKEQLSQNYCTKNTCP